MGLTVGQTLAERGAMIVFSWRSSRAASEEAVRQLRASGYQASSVQCDVSRQPDVRRALAKVVKQFGRLDVVVNLASIYEAVPLSRDPQGRAWTEHMAANAWSAWVLSTESARYLKRNGAGRIIHVADWTSSSGRPRYKDYAGYYVSKKAVQGVVEAMALELSPEVLVNGIAPGPMLPPAGMSAKEQADVRKATPLNRWGGAAEMAKTVLFLIETDFVTGETIRLDGGRHLY